MFGHWLSRNIVSSYLYTDQPYIPEESYGFKHVNLIFSRDDPVKFVLPDSISSELRDEIENLKDQLVQKYGDKNYYLQNKGQISEINSSSVACNSYSELDDYTLIIVGNSSRNTAVKCLPWFSDSIKVVAVERNVWGSDKYAFIINNENPDLIKALNVAIKEDMLEATGSSWLIEVSSTLDTCGMLGFVPYIDVAGDFCDFLGDCGHFADSQIKQYDDNGKGMWCAFDTIVFFIPGISAHHGKLLAKIADVGEDGFRFINNLGGTKALELAENLERKGLLDYFTSFLQKYGDEVSADLVKNSDTIKKITSNADGSVVLLKRGKVDVETRYIDDGEDFIQNVLKKNPYDPSDANKADIGEEMMEYIRKDEGLVETVPKFPIDYGDTGFDGVYKNSDTGDFIIFESKLTTTKEGENIYRNTLKKTKNKGQQMDDEWITETINEMMNSGDPDIVSLGNQLDEAWGFGKIKKRLVVTKSSTHDGKTIGNLEEFNFEEIHIVQLGYKIGG